MTSITGQTTMDLSSAIRSRRGSSQPIRAHNSHLTLDSEESIRLRNYFCFVVNSWSCKFVKEFKEKNIEYNVIYKP